MPNMPATDSAWTRFAPGHGARAEDAQRHQRVAGRRLADDEGDQQRRRRRRRRPACAPAPQPSSAAGLTIVYTPSISAPVTSTAPGTSAPARSPCRGRRPAGACAAHGRDDADRQVDEEDPVPVDDLGDHAAEQQADRAAGGGDEAVDADRLGLLPGLREHRDDHAEDDGGGQRAADALHEARADEHRLRLRGAARQRSAR